ncbi:hypothetical protein RJ639_023417, partial [Escallonia herrerae]
MDSFGFHDGNITHPIESRAINARPAGLGFPVVCCALTLVSVSSFLLLAWVYLKDVNHGLQMHSSLVRRLTQERELEGHQGCVNSVSWNSKGSLLISGSDDTRINIWSYSSQKLLHSIETGHSANIFCTKFVPETSDERVVSGAADAQVRLFDLCRSNGEGLTENAIAPSALFQCHTRRVKKLAVEVGNPNVVWSASEDGTLRQHDFREGASCPPAGSSHQECRNVLLDLRCGAKKSLSDPPKPSLGLKSCDISSTRPHLLLVGGSDAFARLYDRRMLPPLSSCQKKLPPPPCVNYFCPMHLSDRGRSSLHLTHTAFSPDGEEVLLSYSGEHVYLMDVNTARGSAMRYTSGDASKLFTFSPIVGVESKPSTSGAFHSGLRRKFNIGAQLGKCRKLLQIAERSLKEGTDYYYGIEACNDVLDGHSSDIGPHLMHECLCVRAALLLKRKWKNDVHMAIRDCHRARKIDASSVRAFHCMAEALSQLGKHKEALDFATAAQALAPSDPEVAETVGSIKKQLAAVETEKSNQENGVSKPEPHAERTLSLSDILYRSEANSDTSQDGPRSDIEDSDYDDEVELDFETSMSGDEGRDAEPNIVHGSLNLRIHRRGESPEGRTSRPNGSCGSPASSALNDRTTDQTEVAIDMKQRYVGHCNVGTDIKQASFLGQRGEYIASGSDDGRWFIWEKKTGRLIKMLIGDEA